MARKLRYSERMQVAETGSLGALEHDQVPSALRNALDYAVTQAEDEYYVGKQFQRRLHRAGVEHFGWPTSFSVHTALMTYSIPFFLDLIELVVEEGSRELAYTKNVGMDSYGYKKAPIPEIESKFNDLADRHRFGYRLEKGEIHRIGSPALADVVVGPALLAAQRPGWENVERSFREALDHQRGGASENDDALTAAAAALEAALKAAGIPGNDLGQLARNFRNSDLAAPQLLEVPETLDKLLKRSAAIRNIHGDAHGKEPGVDAAVPQELVDLAIHLVGSFIVYVEAANRARRSG